MADIRGLVTITVEDKKGNVLDSYKGQNKILDAGISTMWQRISSPDGANANQLETLALGSDFGGGSWSIFNPQPPNRGFTASDQIVTHTIAPNSVVFDTPSDIALEVTCVIDGTSFMNSYFPTEVDYTFNSMTLRFRNGTPWSFKRFPIRSISREVVVRISWTFTIINQEEWCNND